MKKRVCNSLAALAVSSLFALPEGLQLIEGAASASSDQNVMTIETGHRAVIHWNSFSIGSEETARFVMPTNQSAVLNRVVGHISSEIYGSLQSNGQVILINQRGVLVGADARIDTGSFIASSLDLFDGDFLKGGDLLFAGDSKEAVVNLGAISAASGDAMLIGYAVKNEGTIEAAQGIAGLGAGSAVFVQPRAEERIFVRVGDGNAFVDNSGWIQAVAAEIKADGNPYVFAIKDSGAIDALGSAEREGRIFLVAEKGALSASGAYVARDEARFLGEDVRLENGAEVAARTVLIGGDAHGKNPDIMNAQFSFVAPNAEIRADGDLGCNGGKVVVWGDKAALFYGTISARGSETGGDGGFVEVSSPRQLAYKGRVDTRAPFGLTGTLLLDPCNVTIGATDSGNYAFGPAVAPCPTLMTIGVNFDSNSSVDISAANVSTELASNNLCINASSLTGSASVGSITVNSGSTVSWSTGNTLTLIASDSGSTIAINGGIDCSNTGPINILGVNSGVYNGVITIGSGGTISTEGLLTIQGQLLNITGGTAEASINTPGAVEITCDGAVTLMGGSTSGASALIATGGTLAIESIGLILIGGGNNDAPAQINCGNALTIDGFSLAASGEISLTGSTSQAEIFTSSAVNNITIGMNGNLSPSSILIQGGSGSTSYASIYTSDGGNIVAEILGAYTLMGGSGASSYASIDAETPGAISLTGSGFSLTAGSSSTSNGSNALIDATEAITLNSSGAISMAGGTASNQNALIENSTGEIDITCATLTMSAPNASSTSSTIQTTNGNIVIQSPGAISMSGGSSSSATSLIQVGNAANTIAIQSAGLTLSGGSGSSSFAKISSGSDLTIDGYTTDSGPILLMGGTASGANALLQCTGSGATKIGTNGNPIPTSLTLKGGVNGSSAIASSGGDIDINVSGNIAVKGGSSSLTLLFLPTGGNVTCNAGGDITFQGGTTTGVSAISGSTTNINITCVNFSLTGGMASSTAGISLGTGDVMIAASGNCTMGGIFSNSPGIIEIETMGNMNLTIGGSATFSGYSEVLNADGNILITAGTNITIQDNASIATNGTDPSTSSVTLVCDNNFPTAPGHGPGQFNLLGSSVSLVAGTSPTQMVPLRIFTAEREQNTITGEINDTVFVPGPEKVDSPTEQWYVYYPSSFGGVPFTLFYKTVPSVPTILLSTIPGRLAFAVTSGQIFYEFQTFSFFDWYRWSDFQLDKNGHSIRRRRIELLKNLGPRGFTL